MSFASAITTASSSKCRLGIERLIRHELPLVILAPPEQAEQAAARNSKLENRSDVLAAGWTCGCTVTQVWPGLRFCERGQQELALERVIEHDALGIARRER